VFRRPFEKYTFEIWIAKTRRTISLIEIICLELEYLIITVKLGLDGKQLSLIVIDLILLIITAIIKKW
jgi:hypothetical protein